MNLLCGAPEREDVPAHAVVAEAREKFQGPSLAKRIHVPVLNRQVAALGEAADGQKFPVRRPHVLLVRAVLADAGDEGLHGNDPLIVLVTVVTFYPELGRDSLPSIGSILLPLLMIQRGASTQ